MSKYLFSSKSPLLDQCNIHMTADINYKVNSAKSFPCQTHATPELTLSLPLDRPSFNLQLIVPQDEHHILPRVTLRGGSPVWGGSQHWQAGLAAFWIAVETLAGRAVTLPAGRALNRTCHICRTGLDERLAPAIHTSVREHSTNAIKWIITRW